MASSSWLPVLHGFETDFSETGFVCFKDALQLLQGTPFGAIHRFRSCHSSSRCTAHLHSVMPSIYYPLRHPSTIRHAIHLLPIIHHQSRTAITLGDKTRNTSRRAIGRVPRPGTDFRRVSWFSTLGFQSLKHRSPVSGSFNSTVFLFHSNLP